MHPNQILFLDIETVSAVSHFKELDTHWQGLWTHKSKFQTQSDPDKPIDEIYHDRAAIFAEFGKICCISVGAIKDHQFRVKSFYGTSETELLTAFLSMIETHYNHAERAAFCGHNIKEFDIPFICRRAAILGLELPGILKINGKKPWELSHIIDTMELWKFGDYKQYTSLDLLAACFNLASSKSDISGKDVGDVFWVEQDLPRIARYCSQDVILTARVYYKLLNIGEIPDDMIQIIA
ncbi:MAG: ribonuclease H-like domain-containing protein [Saprospiraceae bacterium]|nr:ribonuclease H-like domain-containing protein [Saprospiraceae bacterium]